MKIPRAGWLIASVLVLSVGTGHVVISFASAQDGEGQNSAPADIALLWAVPYLAVTAVLLCAYRRHRRSSLPEHRTSWKRRAVIGMFALGGVLIVGLACTWGFQDRLIYYPNRADPGPLSERVAGGQDPILRTADGLLLHSWLLPAAGKDRRAAVLYLPGNGGNRLDRLELAEAIADQGYSVLLVDYRGYGGNPGSPSEDGFAADAAAGVDYLTSHGFSADRIVYVGESIGTGVAARLAAERPPAGLLLRSPYTSLDDVAQRQAPWLPMRWILKDHFDTVEYLPKISCPISVLAGDADALVPPAQSHIVAMKAPHLQEEVVVPGAGHNDPLWFGPRMASWINDLARASIR